MKKVQNASLRLLPFLVFFFDLFFVFLINYIVIRNYLNGKRPLLKTFRNKVYVKKMCHFRHFLPFFFNTFIFAATFCLSFAFHAVIVQKISVFLLRRLKHLNDCDIVSNMERRKLFCPFLSSGHTYAFFAVVL